MFFSKKYNLLFIASPKTGSSSVEDALQKLDSEGEKVKLIIDDKVIGNNDVNSGEMSHVKAREILKLLGRDDYNKLNTIAFIRNPYSKLVSTFFFNKSNDLSHAFDIKGNKKRLKRSLNFFLSTFFAKVLPFKIWAILYPYKSNLSYLTDIDGNLIIKHIGRTEHLNKDFHLIMKKLNIDSKHLNIDKKNTSTHKPYNEYFKSIWFKKIIDKKIKSDIKFYDELQKSMF